MRKVCRGMLPEGDLYSRSNRYVIDEALCNDCADLFGVQCVRVCREGAIVRKEDYLNVIATAGLLGAHR